MVNTRTSAPPRASFTPAQPRPSSSAPPARRFEALDGLRALAVLGVVAVHTGLLSWGWAGVDLFFALSGFLITGILLDAKAAGGSDWASYGKPFYARRALRILPLAYAFMAFIFIVQPALHHLEPTPKREQLWYWLYVSNWWVWPRSDSAWKLSHFWSLAVEEQFYLVWPWVVLALSRKKLGVAAIALLVMAPLCRLAIVLLPVPPQVGHTYEGLTVTRFDGLAAGALVAIIARSEGGLARWRGWFAGALLIGACGFAATLFFGSEQVAFVTRFTALGIAMGAAVAWVLGSPGTVVERVLAFRPLRAIGLVSYCVYVVHLEFVQRLRDRGFGNGLPLFLATLALTLVFATASWFAFEKPLMSLKSRFPMPRRRGARETVRGGAVVPEALEA